MSSSGPEGAPPGGAMFQVCHNPLRGRVGVVRVPAPACRAGHVLIANTHSVLSPGTERAALELGKKSLLGKARERPEQVARVLEKIRAEGLRSTIAQVFDRLDQPAPLGYSSAGVAVACGEGVSDIRPGMRVASNGPHAGVICVPRNLCGIVPEGVPLDQAAYAVLGAIALQGVRLARLGLAETAYVIGLGLVGQLAVALLRAAGCRVLATDLDPWRCNVAASLGAERAAPEVDAREVLARTRGLGADAVLLTASTPSDGPVALAAEAVRPRGRVVAIGAVGLNLPRRPFYFKEAELVVSKSYGPGRYDPEYEERGRDYPPAYVRWTEQRNIQAILDLMACGRLNVAPLTTHRFPIEKAEDAYDLVKRGDARSLGILLEYPPGEISPSVRLRTAPSDERPAVAFLGAGQFARAVLLPRLRELGSLRLKILCSPGSLSSADAAGKFGFEEVTTDEDRALGDPEIKAVFIATRHDQHARLAARALKAGKHVFVEKPLVIRPEEIDLIEEALRSAPSPILMVGFNRRFSPAARAVREFFRDAAAPLTASVRFNAGPVPPDHWTQDPGVGGGRLVGEACHAIDLVSYLIGAPPVRVFAESIGGPAAPAVTEDQCFLTLRHADGSVSSVAYLAGGDRGLPKERVEVFGDGRAAVIDDFREVLFSSGGKLRRNRRWSQDKGHRTELEIFADVVRRGGDAPIAWQEMRAVSLASVLAVRSLREGVPFDVA